jgi:hypothetical protein
VTIRPAVWIIVLALLVSGVCPFAGAEGASEAPAPVALTWLNLLTLAATTGFLTAFFNRVAGWFQDFLTDRRTTRRQAEVLASKLILSLESFAAECQETDTSAQFHYNINGDERLSRRIPLLSPLLDLGNDQAWASIDRALRTQAIAMNLERDAASRNVEGAASARSFDEATDQEVRECFYWQTARVGLRAAKVAEALRSKYGSAAVRGDAIIEVVRMLARYEAEYAPKRRVAQRTVELR